MLKCAKIYIFLFHVGCVELTTSNGYWNDNNCGVAKYFVCERLVNSVPTVIPPTEAAPGNCEPGKSTYIKTPCVDEEPT